MWKNKDPDRIVHIHPSNWCCSNWDMKMLHKSCISAVILIIIITIIIIIIFSEYIILRMIWHLCNNCVIYNYSVQFLYISNILISIIMKYLQFECWQWYLTNNKNNSNRDIFIFSNSLFFFRHITSHCAKLEYSFNKAKTTKASQWQQESLDGCIKCLKCLQPHKSILGCRK